MSEPSSSSFRRALRTPVGIAATLGLVAIIVLAIVAPILWSSDAARLDILNASQGSSHAHPLGTDALGRDILYRVLVATRLSVTLAVVAAGLGALVGIPLGAVPALVGGRVGRIVTGLINLSVAFPTLLVAIFVAAVIGVGARGAVIGIAVAIAPYFARLSQTLSSSVAGSEYLAAARMLGVGKQRLLRRHILPNVAEPLLITMTIAAGDALLALAGLSFLGLGVQPPQYDWGRMLSEGLERIYVTPIVALGPAVAITLGALTFSLFGEMLAKAAAGGGVRRWQRADIGAASVQTPPPAAGPAPAGDVLAVDGLTVSFPGGSVPVR
ncbi:MAG TPA: ABC transporter permease, partial [Gaiellaceae bacterium]